METIRENHTKTKRREQLIMECTALIHMSVRQRRHLRATKTRKSAMKLCPIETTGSYTHDSSIIWLRKLDLNNDNTSRCANMEKENLTGAPPLDREI
ncbi:hypothetical protein LEMLEM_LOCUS16780 [Lemmus lemmus]